MEKQQLKDIVYTERINMVNEKDEFSSQEIKHDIKVDQKVPKLGVMLVGWGGNNGSTFTIGALANKKKLSW